MKATKQVVTISAIFAVLLVALITYTLGAFSEAANTVEPGSVDPLDTAGNTDSLVAAKSAVTSINVAEGTQKITYESGRVLERHVQVWKAKGDDRYRVRVTSLDDTGASEEVAYDGAGHQLVLVTGPGGDVEAFVVEGSEHFAVTGMNGAEEERSGGIVTSSVFLGLTGEVVYEVEGPVVQTEVDSDRLEIAIPEGVVVRDLEDYKSGL